MTLSESDADLRKDSFDRLASNATKLLKTISHEGRLMLLCHLQSGEKSVTALEKLLNARQATVSQHLARLRAVDLVTPRRDGKTIYYSLANDRAHYIVNIINELFDNDGQLNGAVSEDR